MAAKPKARVEWVRQPVVWLAMLLFAATIFGCISMIVLSARHADQPLPNVGDQVFKVPVSRSPPPKKD